MSATLVLLTVAAGYALLTSKSVTKGTSERAPKMASNYRGSLLELSDDPVTRSQQILDLVRAGRGEYRYAVIETASGEKRARIPVFADALAIDGVRVNVTARAEQQIADALGAHLLTQKLADEIHRQADLRLNPMPQGWYADGPGGRATMSELRRMFDYQRILENAVGDVSYKLATNIGKDWLLDSAQFQAGKNPRNGLPWNQIGTNYGWFERNGKPLQPMGRAHSIDHGDYSQLVRLVSKDIEVSDDGGKTYRPALFSDILTDPQYFSLVSYERLPSARHPGVVEGSD